MAMTTLLIFLGLGLIVVFIAQLQKLRDKIDALAARLAALEQRDLLESPASPSAALRPQVLDEPKLVPPKPKPEPEPVSAPESVVPPPLPVTPPQPPPVATPPPLPVATPPPLPVPAPLPTTPFNWEAFMGVKLFAWLGGLALFLGVVFLVKYSFENNLITPLGRIVIGAAVGVILLGVGWWLARGRYRVTAQSLCATGVVILYADIFAAHSFYALISLTSAFLAMSAVTLLSFILAVNLSAQVIVILGLLGGFLTPVLLPSGLDNAPVLFLYVALLDLGIAAVALRKRWLYLLLLAAIGTTLTQIGWAEQFFSTAKGGRAFWIFLGFEALFLAVYFRAKKTTPDKWAAAAASVAGFTALGFGFWICAFPLLARQPFFFFSFIFLADAGLLALPVLLGFEIPLIFVRRIHQDHAHDGFRKSLRERADEQSAHRMAHHDERRGYRSIAQQLAKFLADLRS